MYINHSFFSHSSVKGHLGCFSRLAIVSCATINIGVQVLLWCTDFNCFWYILRSCGARSCGSALFLVCFYLFFRKFHTDFHNGYTMRAIFESNLLSVKSQTTFDGIVEGSSRISVYFNTDRCVDERRRVTVVHAGTMHGLEERQVFWKLPFISISKLLGIRWATVVCWFHQECLLFRA